MKVNELRLGNLVTKGKVRSIYYNQTVGLDDGCSYYEYELTPIPITEDWLKRFGFVNSIESNVFPDPITGWFMLQCRDGYYKLTTASELVGKQFKYVHQLQNLYFALTGEELTLKEHQKV